VSAIDADGGYVLGMKLGKEKPVFERKVDERIHDLDFTPDGHHLIAGGDSGILHLFDTRSKKTKRIDLNELPEVQAMPAGSFGPMILCTRELEEDAYPSAAIHCLSCAPTGDWAAVGLVGGLVVRVPLQI
jgi:WD40 repeat protein